MEGGASVTGRRGGVLERLAGDIFVGFLLAWAWAVTFRGGEIFRGFLLAWGASLEVGRESEGENFRGGDFFFGEYGF